MLIGIQPNLGQVLNNGDTRNIAPSELVFRFDSGQAIDPSTLNGIQITRAGADEILGTGDDVTVVPSREVGPLGNEVILRFGENLPDDRYRALIRGTGATALRNLNGDPFDGNPNLAGPQDFALQFTLDLGTKVSAVVPQPITRDGNGSLSQALDQLEVYFNDNDLSPSLVTDPGYYQLTLTHDTVSNLDDTVFHPTSVAYSASESMAVLTFADDLHVLAGGAGTFRLRLGTNESLPPAPLPRLEPASDPGSSFSLALDVGTLGNASQTIAQSIDDADVIVVEYNFDPSYGTLPDGTSPTNLITEPQKQRVRDAFEIYSNLSGVDVIETATDGLTVATGDNRAESNDDEELLVLSNAVNWNNEFLAENRAGNPSYFSAVMSSIFGFFDNFAPLPSGDTRFLEVPRETILPTNPIVSGIGSDIDMYRFEISGSSPGLFTAELFAERLQVPSGLDGVLRLYRESNGQFELLAQNDDYFSEDSFLTLSLDPGTYYVGVSSAGNDQYDPLFAASGVGGTSQGAYELRLDLRPGISDTLADSSGVALDGDGDGRPGGTFNFWFRAAAPAGSEAPGEPRVIYVDKADLTPDTKANVGTMENPYNILHNAFNLDKNGLPKTGSASDANAARGGDIVRIVGNGTSTATSLPYRIGIDVNTNQPLTDGAKFDIPRDVTVMVDAGAVLKLRRAAILVGSTAISVDHSQAALQVLGTPDSSVVITSVNDLTGSSAARGDWGGILFAGEVDRAEQRTSYEDLGIFLNYVGHADVRYGGGIVNIGSIPQAIAPINIRDSRPTITYNNIANNGIAAISATPDSFEETNFHAPLYQSVPFTSDYTRVGPEIGDNSLSNNNVNGLLVRMETPAGNDIRQLTVAGRWDDTDIVHVLTDVLQIRGTPGGLLETASGLQARTDARLMIDPNVIVKLNGARMEVGIGAQLLAEGRDGQEIVFTSNRDDRFGASGNFDTSNNQASAAERGDWGGIYIGHSSSASIDHANILFGGGVSAVEGNFVGFNAVEVNQSKARITNSTFANNSGGISELGPINREGRGTNAPATIFVRGAQPIIVGNSIASSSFLEGGIPTAADSALDLVPAITINASALNDVYIVDYGRSTGPVESTGILGNQGPLIRHNRLDDNDVNGLLVRGETLTINGVWDDTDMVHVLFNDVHVPNYQTLRLESNATESLVVKLGGHNKLAGFDATGRVSGFEERIGGALQIIGQPGHPVILTSVSDNTVGAGMKLDGSFQDDTLRPGFGTEPDNVPTSKFDINFNFSTEVESNPMLVAGLEEAARFWELQLSDPITINLDVVIARTGSKPFASAGPEGATFPYDEVVARMQADAAADEIDLLSRLPSFSQLRVQGPPGAFEVPNAVSLGTPNAKALGYIEGVDFPSTPSTTKAGATRDGQINVTELYERTSTVDSYAAVFIHEIGHTMGFLTSIPDDGNFSGGTLTAMDLFRLEPGAGARDFTNSPRVFDPDKQQVFYDGGIFDPVGIDIAGITKGDIPLSRGEAPHPDDAQPSHWRSRGAVGMNGITLGIMDPSAGAFVMANDERVLGLMGWDLDRFAVTTVPTPGDWRGIQLDEWSNDRNVGVHTELESASASTTGSNEIPDRAEFLGGLGTGEYSSDENLRLGFEVPGVIDSVDDVDVFSFDAVAGTQVFLNIDRASSSLDTVIELVSADGTTVASSNTFLPVILPGAAGTTGTYYARVRSNGPDLANLTGGETTGSYELGISLRGFEDAGSTIQYADIRYAKTGIEVAGLGAHSPLQTEFVEPGDIADFETALNLGNASQSDRGEISVSGTLEPVSFLDDDPLNVVTSGVDWYTFSGAGVIDVDYADGTGNADTFVSIWAIGTSTGEDESEAGEDDDYRVYDLVYFGEGSNIPEDFAAGLAGGTFGPSDPFIVGFDGGHSPEVLLPDRDAANNRDVSYGGNFLLAISSERIRPSVLLDQFLLPNAINPNARVNVVDLDNVTEVDLSTATIPFSLNDLTLYVTADGPGGSQLTSINPLTGEELQAAPRTLRDADMTYNVASLGMRADGNLFSLSLGMNDGDSGNLLNIDWAQRINEDFTVNPEIVENLADDNIVTYAQGDPDIEESDDGIQFQGMTFTAGGIVAVGNRGDRMAVGPQYVDNIVYLIDGYPTEIDNNQTDPGVALPEEPKRETDPMSMLPMSGAFTDIVELGRFMTGAGGGTIQGIATVDGDIYGISSTGRLFRFVPGDFNTPGTTLPLGPVVSGANFTGLVAGPAGLGLDNILFGMTAGGTLYAFDTAGDLQDVFDGQSSIQTSLQSVTDIAFSTLDTNLWAEDLAPEIASEGTVLSFTAPVAPDPITGFFTGNQSTVDQFNSDYNFPGGAHGYFTLDLASVPADEPFMYFEYLLQTENEATNEAREGSYSDDFQYGGSRANDSGDPLRFPRSTMRDAFRVYATSAANPEPEDWLLLATNNSATKFDAGRFDGRLFPNEFDRLAVQELFDNTHILVGNDPLTPQVRQTRISLAELAGASDVTLRFEFSTEASFNEDRSGDAFGDYLTDTFRDSAGLTDNQAVGDGALPLKVSVGNVFVGTGELGWQFDGEVTAVADGARTPTPPDYIRNPGYGGGNSTGKYQIYLRPSGNSNVFRDQGQLIIHSNQISHSAEYGVLVTESPRLPTGAANLITTNTTRLVRGAVIENNLIADSGLAGIQFDGDATGVGAVRFARIVNNTVVGSTDVSTAGDGIRIGPNASPTLMNNIVAYTDTALSIDTSSVSTVVSGQLLHGNNTNGPLGTFPVVSTPSTNSDGSDGLFRNPSAGNFLLVAGARAIDSSVESQEDRPSISAVLSSIGINFVSPILAPDRDGLGQLRIDDPSVQSLPGLGAKDRGAFERADNAGPRAGLVTPADNSPIDLDPDLFEVSTMGETIRLFEISLVDIDLSGNNLNGVGIDDATVTSDAIVLIRDQRVLEAEIDYFVSYDSTSDIVRLIPNAGVWIPGVYEIKLDSPAIQDLAGNALLSNSSDGTTTFIVGVDRDAVVGGGGNSWHNQDRPGDVNNDGFVVAQDVNIIITEINLRQISDPLTGALPAVATPPPFYDVDNDGFVVAKDANIIITEINLGTPAPLSSTVTAGEPETGFADSTAAVES